MNIYLQTLLNALRIYNSLKRTLYRITHLFEKLFAKVRLFIKNSTKLPVVC